MASDLGLRRKWTFRAHGQQVVFIKHGGESSEHVMMKAFIWALYLPQYPEMRVEVRIGDRYKPDLVELDMLGQPIFWGEAGQVSRQKIEKLVRRYRDTHFVIAKWGMRLDPLVDQVGEALEGVRRTAPFDLISFPRNAAERFIEPGGGLTPSFDAIMWHQFEVGKR